MKKKLLALFMMFAVVIAMSMSVATVNAATKKPTKITLKTTGYNVDIDGKVRVTVKSVKPTNASKAVTYKSSNTKLATVDNNGWVYGKKAGKVTITAISKSDKQVKATIKLTVKDMKSTSITISNKSLELAKDATKKLTATVKGYAGYNNQGVVWSSSDTSIATVTSSGKVVAQKKTGTATITAKEKNGTRSVKCKVTVSIAPAYENEKQVFVSPEWIKSVIDGD